MRTAFPLMGAIVLATLGTYAAQQNPPQEKPKENPPAAETAKPAQGEEKKNPIKPTPEGLAAAKKVFGYDCAMCHGEQGDGKGDLVDSMGLKLKDWREPASLAGMTDGEMYEVISKGRGKMPGEGERVAPERIWNLVNYVKAFAKKDGAPKPAAESSPSE
jgi:mono/diheme cytochrome c family protein